MILPAPSRDLLPGRISFHPGAEGFGILNPVFPEAEPAVEFHWGELIPGRETSQGMLDFSVHRAYCSFQGTDGDEYLITDPERGLPVPCSSNAGWTGWKKPGYGPGKTTPEPLPEQGHLKGPPVDEAADPTTRGDESAGDRPQAK